MTHRRKWREMVKKDDRRVMIDRRMKAMPAMNRIVQIRLRMKGMEDSGRLVEGICSYYFNFL